MARLQNTTPGRTLSRPPPRLAGSLLRRRAPSIRPCEGRTKVDTTTMRRDSLAILIAIPASSLAWTAAYPMARPSASQRGGSAPKLCGSDDADEAQPLLADLKRAASKKLGTNLEEAMKLEDALASRAASGRMAAAIAEAKRQFSARKAEVGEEAALAELDESIRKGDRADTSSEQEE